jgi:hypothetical protein
MIPVPIPVLLCLPGTRKLQMPLRLDYNIIVPLVCGGTVWGLSDRQNSDKLSEIPVPVFRIRMFGGFPDPGSGLDPDPDSSIKQKNKETVL